MSSHDADEAEYAEYRADDRVDAHQRADDVEDDADDGDLAEYGEKPADDRADDEEYQQLHEEGDQVALLDFERRMLRADNEVLNKTSYQA